MTFDTEDLLLEQTDFLQHLGERRAQGLRNLTLGVGEYRADPILGDIHAERDGEAELAQDTAQSIHITLPGAHPLAAQPVQGLDLLSFNGFKRHLANLGATGRLNERRGVRLVSLVSSYIGFHVAGRQQTHGVSQAGNPPRPVVRAATGFHHDLAGRKLNEEAEELGAREPLTLRNTPVLTGHGEFEDIFAKSTATIVAFISDSFWLRLSLKHSPCSAWHIDAVLPSRRSPFQQLERSRVASSVSPGGGR